MWYNVIVDLQSKSQKLRFCCGYAADSTLTASQKCSCKQAFLLRGII